VLLVIAGAALVGLLALGQVPLHDNELEIALVLWMAALPAALGGACLTEWRTDAQERADRGTPLWGESTASLKRTKRAQIVLDIVANMAVVAGYASFAKHFLPSAGVMLFVLTAVTGSAGVAACWPGGPTVQDPKAPRRGVA
jgi:hypothetical protein